MTEMPPDQAVRVLRAKAAELENLVKQADFGKVALTAPRQIVDLMADVALVASFLADFMEYVKDREGR